MPAAKPAALNRRHETAAEKAERAQRVESVRPRSVLPTGSPAQLKGHKVAQAVWRRTMAVYSELDAEIVSMLDIDLLVDYCLMTEQVAELDEIRKSAIKVWRATQGIFDKLGEEADVETKLGLAMKVQDALNDVAKIDGRADRKRDLLLKWRQSLYLTPRARAGAAPKHKEPEPEKDELELLLDDVKDYMNGGA